MAKKRDRRTKKDDVLLPISIIPAIEAMNADDAKQFILGIMEIGKAACEAGFKKDSDELQESIATAVDAQVEQMKQNNTNPLLAFLIDTVAEKIEAQIVGYYTTSNNNSANRSANNAPAVDLTQDQEQEAEKVRLWITSNYKTPTSLQNSIIHYYVAHGGSAMEISRQVFGREKAGFDPYAFMKSK